MRIYSKTNFLFFNGILTGQKYSSRSFLFEPYLQQTSNELICSAMK